MKIYINRWKFLLISLVTGAPVIIFLIALGGIRSGNIGNMIVGLIVLTPIYYMAMFCVKPRIEIENNKLTYRTLLNKKEVLTDFNEIDVFINKEDILFRFEPNIEKIASLFYVEYKDKIKIANAIQNENFKTIENNL